MPLPSRAISHARGHLRVSRFARRTTEKRETARSLPHNQDRTSTSTAKHVQQFGDERLAMVEGGWDPEILITGHAGK